MNRGKSPGIGETLVLSGKPDGSEIGELKQMIVRHILDYNKSDQLLGNFR